MTESELRQSVANALKSYLGLTEGGALHKQLLAIFNGSGLCTRYTMTTSDAWCAAAVSVAFISTDLTDIFPCVECSCTNMITKAKTAGIWIENDAYVPSMGDVIMYDWDDSGSGDNTGTPDHTGIITAVSDGYITVIEGNKSDTVGYRTIAVNGKYIRGFITPDYASLADKYSVGWHKDSTGWWYADTANSYYKSCWAKIQSAVDSNYYWFHFNSEGYMDSGALTVGEYTYYLAESGDFEGACCKTDSSGALSPWAVEE